MAKTKWKAYFAIDPGKQGGWAAIYPNKTVKLGRTPYKSQAREEDDPAALPGAGYQMREMIRICNNFRADCTSIDEQRGGWEPVVLLEMQRPRPVQGRRVKLWGVQETGVGLGMWMMALASARLPAPLWLIPSQWKLCYVPEKADKMASVLKARELYPKAELPFKADNGPAEALLMAHYQQSLDNGTLESFIRESPPVRSLRSEGPKKRQGSVRGLYRRGKTIPASQGAHTTGRVTKPRRA